MTNKTRCFISVDLPENLKQEVVKIQNMLPEFIGKKTESENIHLTLKFLGEVDDSKLDEVKKKLSEIKFQKFGAEIDSLGVFNIEFIRIIWLHLTNCNKLQEEIDDRLKNLFKKEGRFMGHVTIARVKNIKNKKEFLEKLGKIKIRKIKFIVENFKLKKSTLTKTKPIYEDLEAYNLT